MIRNNKLLIAVGATALSVSMYTTAVSAATVTANASANVVQALTITENFGLDFGDVSETAAGTVIMNTAGTRSISGGAIAQPSDTGQVGLYTIIGEDTKSYAISFPASATITDPISTQTMTVDTFTDTADGTAAAAPGEQFNVGATLRINAGQAAGAYTGQYTITVNYN